MTDKEAIMLALEAFKDFKGYRPDCDEAIKALEEALAKQEQGEPVAWSSRNKDVSEVCEKIAKYGVALSGEVDVGPYLVWMLKSLNEIANTPQQRKPLTDEQDTVSKARYNRVRDDYNELLEKSRLDAIAANRWREHVTHCQLQGVDLDHNFAPQQHTWVGLTNDEFLNIWYNSGKLEPFTIKKNIEAKLKEKNT